MSRTPKTKQKADQADMTKTTDMVSVRVVCTKAELDGGLVISLSMKTDTPELPAPVAEALSTLNLVDIK